MQIHFLEELRAKYSKSSVGVWKYVVDDKGNIFCAPTGTHDHSCIIKLANSKSIKPEIVPVGGGRFYVIVDDNDIEIPEQLQYSRDYGEAPEGCVEALKEMFESLGWNVEMV